MRQNVSRETFTNFKNDIQSKINYATVLVAFGLMQLFWLLFWLTMKMAKPTKRPFMAAKLYYAYIALSRVFAEIFQKNFFPHGAHNPETRRTFVLRCVR